MAWAAIVAGKPAAAAAEPASAAGPAVPAATDDVVFASGAGATAMGGEMKKEEGGDDGVLAGAAEDPTPAQVAAAEGLPPPERLSAAESEALRAQGRDAVVARGARAGSGRVGAEAEERRAQLTALWASKHGPTAGGVSAEEVAQRRRREGVAGAPDMALVVDTGGLIRGYSELPRMARTFWTVPEVLAEVRDAKTRTFVEQFPFEIRTREPSPEASRAVAEFARQTGDFHSLSVTDLKVIALAATLEREEEGDTFLRDAPEPVQVDVARRRPRDGNTFFPGAGGKQQQQGKKTSSTNTLFFALASEPDATQQLPSAAAADPFGARRAPGPKKGAAARRGGTPAARGGAKNKGGRPKVDTSSLPGWGDSAGAPAPAAPKAASPAPKAAMAAAEKPVAAVKAEAEGADEDAGNESDGSDYSLASVTSSESEGSGSESESDDDDDAAGGAAAAAARLRDEPVDDGDGGWITPQNVADVTAALSGQFRATEAEVKARKVGCITTDYSMQNVLLQMGLHLVSIDGMHIKRVKQWVLRCFGCSTITRETERKFCPACGHTTLQRVAMHVGSDGRAVYEHNPRRRISIRGVRYSLPKRKGGRGNSDLVLTEDAFLRKAKQTQTPGFEAFAPDAVRAGTAGRRDTSGVTVGYGRRNPNVSRKKRGKKNKTRMGAL